MNAAWKAIGASVRGTSHLKTSLPCQDACAYRVLDSGVFIAAVSDGAGSAGRADLGAQQAVNQALWALSDDLGKSVPASDSGWEALLARVFTHARSLVLALPELDGGEARDYACTLTFAAVNEGWLAVGQLGDGLAVALDLEGGLHMVAEPQRGEYADATYFLTQPDAPDMFAGRVYRVSQDIAPVQALALMTDGLTHLAIDRRSRSPHEPFFQPLLRVPAEMRDPEEALESLYAFLDSDRINQRTDDDKTLVLAGRVGL